MQFCRVFFHVPTPHAQNIAFQHVATTLVINLLFQTLTNYAAFLYGAEFPISITGYGTIPADEFNYRSTSCYFSEISGSLRGGAALLAMF